MRLSLISLAFLASCVPPPATEPQVREGYAAGDSYGVRVWRDTATGCHYLMYGQSITPRLQASGKPACPDVGAAE
jgi:hypothetical protein